MKLNPDAAETIQTLDKAFQRSEADRAERLHMLKQAEADIAARRWLPGFLLEVWRK